MRFISLFAGIGGFDLALTRLGHTCVYANEWDKYASQIYNKNFSSRPTGQNQETVSLERNSPDPPSPDPRQPPHSIDTRDIRTVPASDIPDHDLLVGGFPCQAFSIAGKRKGFDDTRGTLFFEIARILREKHPRLFILENVKGLLSHDNGNTFKTIISTLDELGYDLQWQVLNSKNFGVPQNRERVFIIGNLRGTSRPEVFPVRNTNENNSQPTKELPEQISNTLRTNYSNGKSNETYVGEGKEIKIRRLTPTECERLQGFPDGWTAGVSDTQRYKMCGNAVTVNVVEAIASHL